jgi:hypothetical protein
MIATLRWKRNLWHSNKESTMRKLFMLPLLLILAIPLGSCSFLQNLTGTTPAPTTTTAPTGIVDTANKQLVVAEYAYQAALKAIQVEVRAGRLKGAKAATVQRYVRLATDAMEVARTAVANGRPDMSSLLTLAVNAVSAVVLQLK